MSEIEIGWVSSIVTFYNILEGDINIGFKIKKEIVDKVIIEYPNDENAIDIAKCLAILNIITGIKKNRANIAALMHSSIKGNNQQKEINY